MLANDKRTSLLSSPVIYAEKRVFYGPVPEHGAHLGDVSHPVQERQAEVVHVHLWVGLQNFFLRH